MKRIYFIVFVLILIVQLHVDAQAIKNNKKALPIGVFDSGTGGLTVLEAILALDAFNNETGKPGADGKPDFTKEYFQYLADQANMPYGNYAAENKTDLLKEHIQKNMQFFLTDAVQKPPVKMIVLACNTATAYALLDIKLKLQQDHIDVPVIGVIDAGSKAALAYQQKRVLEPLVFLQLLERLRLTGIPEPYRTWQRQWVCQHYQSLVRAVLDWLKVLTVTGVIL